MTLDPVVAAEGSDEPGSIEERHLLRTSVSVPPGHHLADCPQGGGRRPFGQKGPPMGSAWSFPIEGQAGEERAGEERAWEERAWEPIQVTPRQARE